MIYDCFFSYQNQDLHFVELLVDELENRGLSCWYAPRNISGRYAKAIADGISHCKVFVLVLNERSAVSEAVLNEVEIAHNVSKASSFASIQPLCTNNMDFNDVKYQEMMYYIRRFQFIYAQNTKEVEKIADSIIKSQTQLLEKSQERKNSGYVVQSIEDKRLKIQNELLRSFDGDLYNSVFSKYTNSNVLDVGCGTGEMLVPIAKQFSVSNFIGIDKSERQINTAKSKYDFDNCHFKIEDVTSSDFETHLLSLMKILNINKFDIINISMLLLHLKTPSELLTLLRKYLSEEGTLIIRDIDDGLNFAFPDPQNSFDRIYKICKNDEQSGNRQNGRQVYHDLIQSGFLNVQLFRQGLSTSNMDTIQREALFQMYFPFILENARIMTEKYPWNIEYREDYLWYSNKYEEIHQAFSMPDFIFSLGFVSFVAKI